MERAGARRGKALADRFEKEALGIQSSRRRAFRQLPDDYPDRCVLIDANGEAEAIAERIWTVIASRLFSPDMLAGDDAMARLDKAVAELASTGADH